MIKILGIGVATMDIYVNQKRMYPGGNEYNIACHAKNMGNEAAFLGAFGNDKAGELLEATLGRTGVDCSKCHHEIGSSGYSLVVLKEDGDRVFLDWNKKGVTDIYPIQFTDEELEYCKSFDVCCLGRCASVSLDKIKYLYENGISLCYDFHATFDETVIRKIAPYIRYAFFSCSHLTERETRRYLRMAIELGCETAVGTRGADTLYAYVDGIEYTQEPFKVEAIDALGAGDSFIAGFLTKYVGDVVNGGCEGIANDNAAAMTPERKQQLVQGALEYAARYSAKVVMIEGSIGIYFDVDPDKIDEVVNLKGEA